MADDEFVDAWPADDAGEGDAKRKRSAATGKNGKAAGSGKSRSAAADATKDTTDIEAKLAELMQQMAAGFATQQASVNAGFAEQSLRLETQQATQLAQFKKLVGEEVRHHLEEAYQKQDIKHEEMAMRIEEVDAKHEGKYRGLSGKLGELQQWQQKATRENEVIRDQIKQLEEALAVAESGPTRMPVLVDGYARSLDASVVKLRCSEKISKMAAVEGIEEVLREMGAKPEWTAWESKDDIGKLHILRFTGIDGCAEKRTTKFLQLQRLPKGWRKLSATTPDGEKKDLFISGDKNRKMVRTEIVTKKLATLLAERYPSAQIVGKRQEGRVYSGWLPLARVRVDTEEQTDIEWCAQTADKLKVDRTAILEAIREAVAPFGGADGRGAPEPSRREESEDSRRLGARSEDRGKGYRVKMEKSVVARNN